VPQPRLECGTFRTRITRVIFVTTCTSGGNVGLRHPRWDRLRSALSLQTLSYSIHI